MAKTKEQKTEMLNEMGKIVSENSGIVFVHARGLKVNDSNAMRDTLREMDIGYRVVKKTLLTRSLQSSDVAGEQPVLDGDIAIVYSSQDALAPSREIYTFSKKYKDNLKLIGGIFEKAYMSRDEVMELAQIPGITGLRGMFVNIINAPIQGLVCALSKIAENKS